MGTAHFYQSSFLMYSRFELFIPVKETVKLNLLFQQIVEKMGQLENDISKYSERSETSRLNINAAKKPVKVSSSFFGLLQQCIEYNQKTGGYFNICAGSGSQKDRMGITIDKKTQTVYYESADISIDFGAIGKGLAMEIALKSLQNEGIVQAFINFGESSVFGLGMHPHGDCWPVNIINGKNSLTLNLNNNGLSSSGLHTVNDELTAHIFDPLTSQLVKRNEKIVVKSDSPVLAEVLSTAYYAAPDHKRNEISYNFPDAEIYML